ncbi:MAG TPA: hypothetical protein VM238_07605 [Phycisphaerae bacterium]|nr:hypothetical protein [Phycisphaerae bacterium]
MRHSGSVLVVVLGLLAILAVVGVAFVTMSTLDRSTSASFALQTQMMLSADGAIEYTIHEMVLDVWEWELTGSTFSFTGKLLSGVTNSAGITCEPYDYPSAAADAWLSSPITSKAKPTRMSFQDATTKVFGGLLARGTAKTKPGNWPENLGFPVADSDLVPTASSAWTNGIWVPDLVAPFNQYLVRTSVTVLDHNALINLNAHGNRVQPEHRYDEYRNPPGWRYDEDDLLRKGYFISDVDPQQLGFNETVLDMLLCGSADTPGRWGTDWAPSNAGAGAILCENPSDGADVPFTLDEEFELRRLWGTYFTSRLERFWPSTRNAKGKITAGGAGLEAKPDDYPHATALYTNRLKATTVSWTAEVRGDSTVLNISHATASDQAWSCPKVDLNTASAQAIYDALTDAEILPTESDRKQFVANIIAFRDKDNQFEPDDFDGYMGAERQPFFSEVTARFTQDKEDPDDPDSPVTKETWTIQVELYNPWPGDDPWDNDNALGVNGLQVVKVDGVGNPIDSAPSLSNKSMNSNSCSLTDGTQTVYTYTIPIDKKTDPTATLSNKLTAIELRVNNLAIDQIPCSQIQRIAPASDTTGRSARSFGLEYEKRGTNDPYPKAIPIVYVYKWKDETSDGDIGTPPSLITKDNTGIPIRIMNSVPDNYSPPPDSGGLPIRKTDGSNDFKAFARLGEMNRVLCAYNHATNDWWSTPWALRVEDHLAADGTASADEEKQIKFDWTAFPRAANVLSAGGPWVDGLDNDWDGKTDAADKGLNNATEAGAPEFRVAGKINLNTATTETLNALGAGVGVAGLNNHVRTLRGDPGTKGQVSPTIPILSPAQILPFPGAVDAAAVASECKGELEKRDIAFTRISNIATVRSDTFSIYGTVQVVDPASKESGNIPDTDTKTGVVRSRRFWALVDRSPALAFWPEDSNYIRPRILNFQWLD